MQQLRAVAGSHHYTRMLWWDLAMQFYTLKTVMQRNLFWPDIFPATKEIYKVSIAECVYHGIAIFLVLFGRFIWFMRTLTAFDAPAALTDLWLVPGPISVVGLVDQSWRQSHSVCLPQGTPILQWEACWRPPCNDFKSLKKRLMHMHRSMLGWTHAVHLMWLWILLQIQAVLENTDAQV